MSDVFHVKHVGLRPNRSGFGDDVSRALNGATTLARMAHERTPAIHAKNVGQDGRSDPAAAEMVLHEVGQRRPAT
jgi:hypothetical protein